MLGLNLDFAIITGPAVFAALLLGFTSGSSSESSLLAVFFLGFTSGSSSDSPRGAVDV